MLEVTHNADIEIQNNINRMEDLDLDYKMKVETLLNIRTKFEPKLLSK